MNANIFNGPWKVHITNTTLNLRPVDDRIILTLFTTPTCDIFIYDPTALFHLNLTIDN